MPHLKISVVVFFLTLLIEAGAQVPTEPTFKLFLIGDAGEGDTTGATLHDLRVKLETNPNSAVIFLGDNCYTRPLHGLIKYATGGYDGSELAKKRLMSQLNILRNYKGYAYFIPGNHDWFNKTNLKRGKKYLLAEQSFIKDTLKKFKSLKNPEQVFLPEDGNPGPVSLDFNEGRTRVIFIDTYRLIIEESNKRKRKDTALLNKFYGDLKAQLRDATNKKEKIIIVAHHPIHAKGKHSIPLVFWQGLIRRIADSNTNYPPYDRMAKRLDSLLKAHRRPDIYYVAGHEHSLEYFFNDSLHYLVSGAGSKIDNVLMEPADTDAEFLVWKEEGFFEIAFYGKYEAVLMYHRKSNDSEMKVKCLAGCK